MKGVAAPEHLPAATAAERGAEVAARIDSALPERGLVLNLLADGDETPQYSDDPDVGTSSGAEDGPVDGPTEAVYPFVPEIWLRTAMGRLVESFGAGMSGDLRDDPDRLTTRAVALLASFRLVAIVDGGVLALPLLGRYRGVTAQVKLRASTTPAPRADQPTLFDTKPEDSTA